MGGVSSSNMAKTIVEAPSRFFYLCVLISSIGAFSFGCGIGFTSPTMCANKTGKSSACPTIDCSMVPATDSNHCGNRNKMNCELQFDDTYQSLFGSIINFGCMAGALSGGGFVDKFGKKVAMLAASLFYCLGWLLIFVVPSPDVNVWDGKQSDASNMATIKSMLIAARLIIGFGVGIACCSVSTYQTEICTLDLRGAIGTVFQSFVVIGLFVVYLLGSLMSWRALSMFCLIVSAAGFLLTFLLCESPIWLITKGRNEQAAAALARVRNPEIGSFQEQLADILDAEICDEEKANNNDNSSTHSIDRASFCAAGGSVAETGITAASKHHHGDQIYLLDEHKLEAGGLSELCGDALSRRALYIGMGLMAVQQLSGNNAIMFYAGQIFSAVPGTSDATANAYSTGMQGVQLVITCGSAFFMDTFGRVKILLFAVIGQCLCAMCLASYYLFAACQRDDPIDHEKVTEASLGLFPVFSLYGYVMFFSCGMGAIPWFIMGEISKPNVKGIASSIVTATNWLLSFIITFSVTGLSDAFKNLLKGALPDAIDSGMGGLFLAYGSICFCGVFFILKFVPETKGLTMKEVQLKLAGGKKSAEEMDARLIRP